MATANENINSTSKLDTAINKFAKLINIHKTQVNDRFKQLHEILNNKQTSLINQLDKLLNEITINTQTQDLQIKQLSDSKEQLQHNLTHNNLNTVLERTLKDFQDNINKLESDTLCVPIVDIHWDDLTNYNAFVNNICKLEVSQLSYTNKSHPKWSTVSKGEGQKQLLSIQGLAIDQDSGNIYVADYRASRIQIFNNIGQYIRTIKTDVDNPSRIIVDSEYCYVICDNILLKINKLTECIVHKKTLKNSASGLDLDVLDNISIYVCLFYNKEVYVVSKTKLERIKIIQLKTEHSSDSSPAWDIKLLTKEIIILFTDTDYPLQSFNKDGVLLRKIIGKQHITLAYYFCIDINNNFIISDFSDDNIKIFNSLGKLMVIIGKSGHKAGQFKNPRGICLDLNNRIIICDMKDKYKLQSF